MPPPGRMVPPRAPRPAKRQVALLGGASMLLLTCIGLLVWAWQEEESARAKLARAIPAGYGVHSPLVEPPESSAGARAVPAAALPAASIREITPGEPADRAASADAALVDEQDQTGNVAFAEESGQFATAAGAAALDPGLLIARGDDYFARSDVVSARLFYQRAAEAGSAAAAAAMAKTYDPNTLDRRAIRGASPDPLAALDWYRKAADLGDASANTGTEELLRRLQREAADGDARAREILGRALR